MAIDIKAAFEQEPPPLDFVLPSMLAGTVGALVSPGGAGKSMIALQIGATLAGGPDLLELGDYETGPVVYLPAEDPPTSLMHRLHALGHHLDPDQREAVEERMIIEPLIGLMPNIMDDQWFEFLVDIATDKRLLILDTLRRFHTAEENDSGAMAQLLGRLEAIAARTGSSILFLHHSSKSAALSGQGDQQQASRGSSVLVDNTRWQSYVLGMSPSEAETYGVDESQRHKFARFGVSKANYGVQEAGSWYRRHEGGVLLPAVLEHKSKGKTEGKAEPPKARPSERGVNDGNW